MLGDNWVQYQPVLGCCSVSGGMTLTLAANEIIVTNRTNELGATLARRIMVLDGGMGTMIQNYQLQEADYRGQRFADWPCDVQGNNDLLVLSKPNVVSAIHDAYLAAGADILETNTFNATTIAMADYQMASLASEINFAATRLARERAYPGKAAICRGRIRPNQPHGFDIAGCERSRLP